MAHIHEKIDFTTSVYVVHENNVLLHKHKLLGLWLPPGGHIELDEDPNVAAVREVKEEAGFTIELIGNERLAMPHSERSHDLIPPVFLNRHQFSDTHEHVDLVYFGRIVSGSLKPEENVEMRWLGKSEIETNAVDMPSDVRMYALAALERLNA